MTDRRTANVTRLVTTLLDARRPLRQQAEDWAEGFAASSGGEGVTGGGIAKPVEAAIIAPDKSQQVWAKREGQGLADNCTDIADAIDDWLTTGQQLVISVLRLLPLEHPVAQMLARHAEIRNIGEGACQKCHRIVAGTEADRLRAGWCDTHYRAWIRAGRPDRATFNASPEGGDNETPAMRVHG